MEGFLPSSYLVVLGGNSKSGKSCLTTALSMAVATGQEFLDMPTTKGAVLWVAYEESEQERALILKQYSEQPEGLYISHDKLHIDSADGIAALRYWVRKTGAKLIVIDPLYGANTADSLSDGRKAREVLSGLKELCRVENVAAIVLHHFTKNVAAGNSRERFADSSQILAAASMDIRLESTDKPDGSREIKLTGSGRGAFANQTWRVTSKGETDFRLCGVGANAQAEGEFRDEAILRCIRDAGEPLTADEIARRVNQLAKTVRNRLTELVKDGRLLVNGKFANANLYAYPQKAIEGLEEAG